jgi:hypothetical protein
VSEHQTTPPLDLVAARAQAERMQAAAWARGEIDAAITTRGEVYLWLLDMAEEALIARRAGK